MAQLVARLSGGQEAVSSSLATPTKHIVVKALLTKMQTILNFLSIGERNRLISQTFSYNDK